LSILRKRRMRRWRGKERQGKSPNRFVAKIVTYFTVCEGRISKDPNAGTSQVQKSIKSQHQFTSHHCLQL